MNAAERLYAQYQKDLQHLQETCPHEQLADWMEEWWAPGHGTGRKEKGLHELQQSPAGDAALSGLPRGIPRRADERRRWPRPSCWR
jgi:hypothetical protein